MKSIDIFQFIHLAWHNASRNKRLAGVYLSAALSVSAHAQSTSPTQTACIPQQHACQFILPDRRQLAIEFNGQPSALHAFKLWVTVPGAHSLTAQFTMPDMDMGENRYRLQPLTGEKWQATVILPACMMGGHRWLMTLKVDNEVIRIPFAN